MIAILHTFFNCCVTSAVLCYMLNCLTKVYAIHQIVHNPKMSNDKAKSIAKIVRTDFVNFISNM